MIGSSATTPGRVTPGGVVRKHNVKTLTNPRLLYLKAALFVVAGTAAGCLVVVRQPALMTVLLLVITVWAFCRAYYFVFYVIEHYIDPLYRFSGVVAFMRYLLSRQGAQPPRSSE